MFSNSPEETEALGVKIALKLAPGSVLAINGTLGAGKTCLAKGIALGLGIKDTVTSPTYTIINEYYGTIPLYHIDAYRLTGDEDFENTGALELIGGDGITLIEWSERIPRSVPPDAISISIKITGPFSRVFYIDKMERFNECPHN